MGIPNTEVRKWLEGGFLNLLVKEVFGLENVLQYAKALQALDWKAAQAAAQVLLNPISPELRVSNESMMQGVLGHLLRACSDSGYHFTIHTNFRQLIDQEKDWRSSKIPDVALTFNSADGELHLILLELKYEKVN